MPLPICEQHKNYQGKRKPVNGCVGCQKVYDYLHGLLPPKEMSVVDTETKDKQQAGEPAPCNKHPKYKAVRKPKPGCAACLDYYNKKHGIVTKEKNNVENGPVFAVSSEPLEPVETGPWAPRKPATLDAHYQFMCTRPCEEDLRRRGESICGNMSFFVTRRNEDVYFTCTFCGRQYRAEAKNNELYYTQQPIAKPRKLVDVDDSETMDGVPKETGPETVVTKPKRKKRKTTRKKKK